MMHPSSILLDLQYLPNIEYFCCLYYFEHIVIERHENFQKQSYRNRCLIRGANKIESLIVPVKHNKNKGISEVEIDYNQKWIGIHINALKSAYGNSPYFEYFSQEIFDVIRRKYRKLFDLNFELLTKCLKLLGMEKEIKFTDSFDKLIKNTQIDARGLIHPKKPLNQLNVFQPIEYDQIFGSNFAANLSIIDLLFCMGGESTDVIKKSLQS